MAYEASLRGLRLPDTGKHTMRILLTNDDGPFGPGLLPLRRHLAALGDVTIVCPAEERSGVGHAITYLVPVRPEQVRLTDGTEAWLLNGTPADCVKFAILEILGSPPDLVAAGVNLGSNVGVDVFYSGTVAAALEGGLYGAVAAQAARVLAMLLECDLPQAWVFNVNIPSLPEGCRGEWQPAIRFTSQSPAFPPGAYSPTQGTRGRVQYWLDSTVSGGPSPAESDVVALESGQISVTPLRPDLTDWATLRRLVAAADVVSAPAARATADPEPERRKG
jgi:5'-nucleotidase